MILSSMVHASTVLRILTLVMCIAAVVIHATIITSTIPVSASAVVHSEYMLVL